MRGQTVILNSRENRVFAKSLINGAPQNAVVNIHEENRTLDQNALMWALLSDISRAKPQGRRHTAETWKALFMHACGHAVQFEEGLDGKPFPVGFWTSRLTKSQMSDLIDFICAYGAENGVQFRHPTNFESSSDAAPKPKSDDGEPGSSPHHGPAPTDAEGLPEGEVSGARASPDGNQYAKAKGE